MDPSRWRGHFCQTRLAPVTTPQRKIKKLWYKITTIRNINANALVKTITNRVYIKICIELHSISLLKLQVSLEGGRCQKISILPCSRIWAKVQRLTKLCTAQMSLIPMPMGLVSRTPSRWDRVPSELSTVHLWTWYMPQTLKLRACMFIRRRSSARLKHAQSLSIQPWQCLR